MALKIEMINSIESMEEFIEWIDEYETLTELPYNLYRFRSSKMTNYYKL